jgi:signal transduction histidine kinase/CheY-like chemotaxis protein
MSTPDPAIDFARAPHPAPPSTHVAQFFRDDETLLRSAETFVGEALAGGGAGILLATAEHARELERRWRARGMNLVGLRERGLYVALEAGPTLDKLLLAGWPQERRFNDVIEPLVAACARRGSCLRVFGELVRLLCERGQCESALHLEELWNRLGQRHAFGLMCAYPASFSDSRECETLVQSCSPQSSIVAVPRPAIARRDWTDDRRAFASLQVIPRGPLRENPAAVDIERAREDAARAAAGRRKDIFLSTLAHELRNPLAPIRNAVEIMRIADADRAAIASARLLIERQLKQLVRLIDDLLDVSRITQGRLELRRERINLATAVQMAVETSRPLIEARQHHLEIRGPREPLFVNGDARRLAQVFGSLLGNSAKYSPPLSTITVALRAEGELAVVSVSDTGSGIPDDIMPRIFGMFELGESDDATSREGLGVGLTLVKRLVELHGGSVEAHSEGLDRGSTFTIRLPLWHMPHAEEAVIAHPPASRASTEASVHRVLVVDDNKDAATSLSMMLALDGHEVRRAYDGIEALEVAEEFRPEVVLLDIGMPRMDGYATARELRKRPWARDLFLVAVTGWGHQEDKRRSAEAGINRHLVKPVEPEILRQLVEELRT